FARTIPAKRVRLPGSAVGFVLPEQAILDGKADSQRTRLVVRQAKREPDRRPGYSPGHARSSVFGRLHRPWAMSPASLRVRADFLPGDLIPRAPFPVKMLQREITQGRLTHANWA